MTSTIDAAPGPQATGKPWSRHTAQKRAAILAAAVEVFVRDGFSAASVDDIAALAKVGKQTVYNYFGDKQQLFLAAIEQAEQDDGDDPDDVPPASGTLLPRTRDPLEALTEMGIHVLEAILDPDRAALHRLTIAELARHPELQQMWSDTAGNETIATLTGYLADLTERGSLQVTDPELTARQFVVLLAGEGRARSLHGIRPLGPTELRTIAHDTADLIIRASTASTEE